jgi:indole-3-glycerol phosphate synthase
MLKQIIQVKEDEMKQFSLPPERQFNHYSLFQALSKPKRVVGLIAEVKKASPSKGIIREDFHPVEIAKEYLETGVDAISVLTDTPFFQGAKEYLTEIKNVVDVPILRKDFIVDRRQILESKYIGADAILLIGEVLEPTKLKEFYLEAEELGLECLVEVHSTQTVESLLQVITPKIIGINNRDLSSFITLPSGSLIVSESGIHTLKDLQTVKEAGAKAILVGEAFMKEREPGIGIKKLFGEDFIA